LLSLLSQLLRLLPISLRFGEAFYFLTLLLSLLSQLLRLLPLSLRFGEASCV